MILRSSSVFRPDSRLVLAWLLATASCLPLSEAHAQTIGFTELRPFVVGIEPVVGRSGAVGGVSIDADGVLTRTSADESARLRDVRQRAAAAARPAGPITETSPLRKVSLRRLQAAIDKLHRQGKPVTDELQNLAGLARVEYVLAMPGDRDIVLAGPAEGWTIAEGGAVVGRATGRPVLQLDDLVVALRSARSAATGRGITCSIDPTEQGLARLERLLKSRSLTMDEQSVSRLEQAVGPQQITITGVSPGSHFANVLVGADFLMKRLAMGLEPAPLADLPSYLDMLEGGAGRRQAAMPRFWMAPNYEPLLKDAEGLAWQLRGIGVKALTEEGFLAAGGAIAGGGKEDRQGKKWADAFTERYEALSAEMPAFGELRNCMDLAVAAAILLKEDLAARADCDLSLLLDEKRLAIAEFHTPRSVASHASVRAKGRQWIVGISGGVDVNSWEVLEHVELDERLATVREQGAASGTNWWWD